MGEQSRNHESPEFQEEETGNPNSSSVEELLGVNLLSQILGFSEQEIGDTKRLSELENLFLPIAEKHRRVQQLNESILSELVSAIVSEIPSLRSPLSDQLIEWVTGVLYGDAHARGRLERLWVQLIGRFVDGE